MSGSSHYDRRTIALHWLTAALVVTLWGLAQIIDFFPTALRVYPRSAHILFGVALAVIYTMRVIWRNTSGRSLPPADTGWMRYAAKAAHYGLYALVAAAVLLGLTYEAVRGDNILNLFRLPSIAPGDKALRGFLGDWHGTAANAVLILAGLHASAALFHQYVLKDRLLNRMIRG
jgi:cytochrome b561